MYYPDREPKVARQVRMDASSQVIEEEPNLFRVLTSPEKPRQRPRTDILQGGPGRLSVWVNEPATQAVGDEPKDVRYHPYDARHAT